MLRLVAALLVVLPLAAARAGDMPVTARSVLDGTVPREARTIEVKAPVGITAILPSGDDSPPVCILGPVTRFGTNRALVPEHWTWFVEAAGPLDAAARRDLIERVRDEKIPGLSLMMQPVGDADLEPLRGCADLVYLDLGRTGVTDAGLVHVATLPGLLALDLAGCAGVTDAGLASLEGLGRLVAIDLGGCGSVGDAGVARLVRLETHIPHLAKAISSNLSPVRIRSYGLSCSGRWPPFRSPTA